MCGLCRRRRVLPAVDMVRPQLPTARPAMLALVAVLAGMLLALGVDERVNGGDLLAGAGDGAAAPLGSGQ